MPCPLGGTIATTSRIEAASCPKEASDARHWSRRVAQLTVTAVLAVIGVVALTPAAAACACGGIVAPAGNTTVVTQETSLIALRGGRETIVMALSARSDATRAGLLVPTPQPATPALADRTVFSDLARQTAPRPRGRHHLFGPPVIFGGDGGERSANTAPAGSAPSVHVLRTVDLGPLRATTLTANDPGALHTWLSGHGFVMSPQFEALVTPYLHRGWAFTAMTLTPDGTSLSGDLPPVQLTFDSDRLIYPMRMSRGAKETQHVRTYVIADHRVTRTDPTKDQGDVQVVYADRLRTALIGSPTVRRLSSERSWLTEITQTFDDPAAQIRSDFTFARAPHDTPVVSYRYTDDYLIPGDVAALLGLALVAAVGGVALLVRRQRNS